jgi:predicted outer membrane repeat protein
MNRKLARRMASAAAAAIMAGGLWSAPVARAAAAFVQVPCDATMLASDMAAAANGETLSLAARCVYHLTSGLPAVSQDLTILGNRATLERSYAPGTPAFTILQVDAGDVAVSSLNFRHGYGAITVSPGKPGVGSPSLTVSGGAFTANTAVNGGAIHNDTAAGLVTVSGAAFIGNKATAAGGAIYDYSVFGMDISDSTFSRNHADYGGAVFGVPIPGDSFTRVVIHNNTATRDGGGIYGVYCQPVIVNSRISGNHAGNRGGGIYQFLTDFYTGITITGTVVRGNTAQVGGGIYANDTIVNVAHSRISHNQATANGGGIFNESDPYGDYGIVNLQSSKLSGNDAGADGGAIYNQGTVDAAGTRIVRNTAAGGGGGIFDEDRFGPGAATVTLTRSPVRLNRPDNCEPANSITGCTG